MSEIHRTGSEDQVHYWFGLYDAPPIEPEELHQIEEDEQEQEFWATTEPPAEDLLAGLEKVG